MKSRVFHGGSQSLATVLFFHLVLNSVAEPDRIYLRNGTILTGTIASETKDHYQVVVPKDWSTTVTNVPVAAVRYVLYATPDKAVKSLGLDQTISSLSLRNEGTVEFLPTESFGQAIVEAAKNATDRIWILAYYITGSSYPSIKEFYDTLCEKAKAGVDVRIISEFGKSTPMPIRNATMNFSQTLRDAGVKIQFIQEYKVLHKKVIIVDGRKVLLGSSNLTAAGTTFSDEFNVMINSQEFAKQAEADFLRIGKNAKATEELKH